MDEKRKAVVLLSGGLDSTVTLAIARSEGFALHALTIQYGQRHAIEIDAARRVAAQFGVVQHVIVPLDLRAIGGSALTSDIDVPKDRTADEMAGGIPITYVPARNTLFLALALGWAEVLGARDLFIGVNVLDYSGYADCRPEFLEAFEQLAKVATKAGVEGATFKVHTPLIHMTKADIVGRGVELGVDFALTTSCYDPALDGTACGRCDACVLRLRGFAEAGVHDPRGYEIN